MNDPYSLLKVARDADPETIKQAYRRLAKKLHPDRNLGDPRAEQRFKDITQAYDLLSDRKTRRDYDRGRIDASGQRKSSSFANATADGRRNGWWSKGIEEAVGRIIGKFGLNGAGDTRAGSEPSPNRPQKGAREGRSHAGDEAGSHHHLDIDFLKAVLGGKQRIRTADGRMLDIDIPPGTVDKALLRLKGQGSSARQREGLGDLLVSIKVRDHPLFTRRGQDLYLDLPISLREALLGAKVRTPTVDGAVWLAIPTKANSGQILRLKGKGVVDRDGRRGDQYVRLMVTLPKEPNAAMAADLQRLAGHEDYDVRAHFVHH